MQSSLHLHFWSGMAMPRPSCAASTHPIVASACLQGECLWGTGARGVPHHFPPPHRERLTFTHLFAVTLAVRTAAPPPHMYNVSATATTGRLPHPGTSQSSPSQHLFESSSIPTSPLLPVSMLLPIGLSIPLKIEHRLV